MLSERHAGAVIVKAPAKVNLFLEVLAKRPDGYHEIATLMIAVSLYDTLEFKEDSTGQIQLTCDNPELSTGPDNLVVRAAQLLRQRTGCDRGAQVDLQKVIPLAAGLAGGSTDAAAALTGLNELWELGLSNGELAELGAELGSDVAFFFATPAAWCTGRGEKVRKVEPGGPLWFVLLCPSLPMSTARVYGTLSVPQRPIDGGAMLRAMESGNVEAIGAQLHNRLQPVAESLCPALAEFKTRLTALAPAGVLMSGSGSSYFALCRDRQEALRIMEGLPTECKEGMNARVFIVRSCLSGATDQ
jgi:4-diphosphocytidyl-2-C-methyl-D-erythritol kinase